MSEEIQNINVDNKKYFWSPAVRWKKSNDEVIIEMFSYKGYIIDLFPKFYFITQKGISLNDLINEFPESNEKRLINFVQDLIKKNILVDAPLSPQELFYPQSYIFKNEYSEKIKYDEQELKKFKEKQLNRVYNIPYDSKIYMSSNNEYPSCISERKTYRTFNTNKIITFETFSAVLSILKQLKSENEIRYYYASAGGLYPIDVYIYVKDNKIDKINKGLYYFSPIENSITLVDGLFSVPNGCHYFTNQSIFDDSAFSIFFIYNAEVSMPKYGGMGYFYACIDAGIMISTLTFATELYDIGLCSIGDMNFKKIEKYFKLNENQIHIHTIELGLKCYKE